MEIIATARPSELHTINFQFAEIGAVCFLSFKVLLFPGLHDPSPIPRTTGPHPHTHLLLKNVLLVQNDDRGKLLCWSLVIISTVGIMNKLEVYYLLALVNSEITEGIITKESIIHTISHTQSFPESHSQRTNQQADVLNYSVKNHACA